MWLQLLFYLSLVACAQGVFLGGVQALKAKSLSTLFLGGLVIFLSLSLLEFGLENGFIPRPFHSIVLPLWGGVYFLFGPFLFLFVSYYQKRQVFQYQHYFHFMPFLLYTVLVLATFRIAPANEEGIDYVSIVLHELLYIQMMIYSYLSLRKVRTFMVNDDHKFVSVMGFVTKALFYMIVFILFVFNLSLWGILPSQVFAGTHIIIITLIYYMSYQYLATSQAMASQNRSVNTKNRSNKKQIQTSVAKVQYFMAQNEPYTDPDLTLSGLAKKVNLSSQELSQVLNISQEGGFYAYINELRAKKACTLLEDPANQQFTLSAIGEEAGFKSRTTFIKYFKKVYGQSPSKYRKMIADNSN